MKETSTLSKYSKLPDGVIGLRITQAGIDKMNEIASEGYASTYYKVKSHSPKYRLYLDLKSIYDESDFDLNWHTSPDKLIDLGYVDPITSDDLTISNYTYTPKEKFISSPSIGLAKNLELGVEYHGKGLDKPSYSKLFYCEFCRMDVKDPVIAKKHGNKIYFCPRCGGSVVAGAKSRTTGLEVDGVTQILK